MNEGAEDVAPGLGPKLAWQPAEAALTEMVDRAANFEERRSTMAPPGAHNKDVQWKRIRCAVPPARARPPAAPSTASRTR